MALTILYFLLILVGIVMVHEFGHFIFAKMFGVYVTEFSIGFGPKLFSIKGKETEYCFKPILLGGYVKMAGDNPGITGDEVEKIPGLSKERLLYSQKAWKRFLIVFAGPLFSILAGYALMMVVSLIWGFPQVKIDWVVPNSPAAEAGLQNGDILRSVNGHVILSPTEVSMFVKGQNEIKIEYIRNGKIHHTSLVTKEIGPQYFLVVSSVKVPTEGNVFVTEESLKNVSKGAVMKFSDTSTATLMEYQKIPRAKEMGIYMAMFSPKIASVDPITHLKSGNVILSIDGMPCSTSFDFQNALFVASVAATNGSLLITNGNKILTAQHFHTGPNGSVIMKVKDGAKVKEIILNRDEFKAFLNSVVTYPAYKNWYPGVWDAAVYGVIRTNRIFTKMLVFLAGVFKTKNALNQFVGPVGLVKMVGQASSEGMEMLLTLIAFITLNLGLVNLLPLPALDGGHLVFAVIEMVTGKRVNPEIEGYVHTVGFFLLMAFFVYITYLDIVRFGG
jgi:regulator of sigma E protease